MTDDTFQQVLDKMAQGLSVIKACDGVGTARSMFYRAMDGDSQEALRRRDDYTRAQSAAIKAIADDTIDLADRAIQATDNVQVQGLRLAVETRKWLLSKIAHRTYGDRLDTVHSGSVTLTVTEQDAKL